MERWYPKGIVCYVCKIFITSLHLYSHQGKIQKLSTLAGLHCSRRSSEGCKMDCSYWEFWIIDVCAMGVLLCVCCRWEHRMHSLPHWYLAGYCSVKARQSQPGIGSPLYNTLSKKGLHGVWWKHIVLRGEILEVRNYFGPLLLRIIRNSDYVLTVCSFSPCTHQSQLTFRLLVFSAVCQPNITGTGRRGGKAFSLSWFLKRI